MEGTRTVVRIMLGPIPGGVLYRHLVRNPERGDDDLDEPIDCATAYRLLAEGATAALEIADDAGHTLEALDEVELHRV